jgi:hypothetical protein
MADHFHVLDVPAVALERARGKVTTGNITVTNVGSTWTQAGALAFAIPAVVGDYVLFQPSFMYLPASSTSLDIAVKVGASFVRFASTDTAAAAVEGDPTMYFDPGTYRTMGGGVMDVVAEAGDLSGGNITFAVVYKGTGTTATIYASSDLPFRWRAINFGPI